MSMLLCLQDLQGNFFELAKECCRQKIRENKMISIGSESNFVERAAEANAGMVVSEF